MSGRDITAVPTSVTAFVGRAARGPAGRPVEVGSPAELERRFGRARASGGLVPAVHDYFANGGQDAVVVRVVPAVGPLREAGLRDGLAALDGDVGFNLLCLPPDDGDVPAAVWAAALRLCARRRAFLLLDPPAAATPSTVAAWLDGLGLDAATARNGALYFPRLLPVADQGGGPRVPSGAVAGVFARTDRDVGVWRAPAGTSAVVHGTAGPQHPLSDVEQDELNRRGVSCLRTFPGAGTVVWGARTLRGTDPAADDYRYVPVRRLALFLEDSLDRGLQWAVFEPNGERLWAEIRARVGSFLLGLFRAGAFAGATPAQGYFVRCDAETTTASDVAAGLVNVLLGFAPARPAEFLLLRVQLRTAPQE